MKVRRIPLHPRAKELILSFSKKEGKIFPEVFTLPSNIKDETVRDSFAYFALKRGLKLSELYLVMGYDDIADVMKYFEFLPGKLV